MLVSSIGLKGFALATSAVAHAALAVVALTGSGHGPAAIEALAVAGEDTVFVDIVEERVEEPAPAEVPEPRSVKPSASPARVAAASHTHAYPVLPDHDAHAHAPELAHAQAVAPSEASSADPYRATDVHEHVHEHEHEHEHEGRPATGSPIRIVVQGGSAVAAPDGGGSGGTGFAAAGSRVGVAPGEIVPAARVSVAARPLSTVRPAYPADAKAEGVEGDVLVEIVVDTAGAVVDARVAKRAGYGFDAAALDAIRRFRFSPAQLEGAPVRVRMVWPVQFRLN